MTLKRFLLMLTLLAMATAACAETDQQLPAPIQALQSRGIQVVGPFNTPGGVTGYAGFANQQPVAMYLTEDGQHVIIGAMLDAQGNPVNRDTVENMVAEPMTQRIWGELENSTWVADGQDDAPHTFYVFSDPNCPYCHLFWQRIRPWVDNGTVQLRHLLVGIIGEDSPNKAAAILNADNPEQAFVVNEKRFSKGGITPAKDISNETHGQLMTNLMLMRKLGLRGTPGIAYRDDKGHVQFWRGVPKKEEITSVLGNS